jgi:glycosyltransferase involved in cell wall biosynthesis
MSKPIKRLVIVARADPVLCGHSTEARNLAEVALCRGFNDVRIVTWPLEALQNLPLKPLDQVLPYSRGIVVERPEPIGDYKCVDCRFSAGLVGRLVELFTDGVPTTCLSLYLVPHDDIVANALRTARLLRTNVPVTTYAEAVGSDITNVVRDCLAKSDIGSKGFAASIFATYLNNDRCAAVSQYTKDLIIQCADELDKQVGTTFGTQCRRRIVISYPAINTSDYVHIKSDDIVSALQRRGLRRNEYVLFLSRITPAKGVDDLLDGYAASVAKDSLMRNQRETRADGREHRLRAPQQAAARVRGDFRHRARGEDAIRWRPSHHDRHRRHPRSRW